MLEFIFSLILMLCLGAVLYIMVRALPRLEEAPEGEDRKGAFERWAHSEFPEKIDAALNSFTLKSLRRAKVFVLKIDNSIAKGLRKVQPAENRANTNIDFREISGQNSEGKESEKEVERSESVE